MSEGRPFEVGMYRLMNGAGGGPPCVDMNDQV